MKNKVFAIIILILLSFALCLPEIKLKIKGPVKHKILKVVEADLFYIDLNDNNKIDDNELIKLTDVIAFKPILDYKTKNIASEIGLSVNQYLKLGYLARSFAKDNFENKDAAVLNLFDNKYLNKKFANIEIDNNDVGEIILKNSLGTVYKNSKDTRYLQMKNIKSMQTIAKALDNDCFAILNLKNNVYHKLNCKWAKMLSNGLVITSLDLNENNIPCKSCYKENEKLKSFKYKNLSYDIPLSIGTYKTSIYKNYGFIEFYYINPLENKKPLNNCSTMICKRIVKEINNSKTSIDIALYEIDNQVEIINALNNAKQRNVKIRAVVDKSKTNQYKEKFDFINNFDCRQDYLKSLMHNKFIIFDNKKVLTGSTNFTNTGFSYNSNSSYVLNSSKIANYYKNEFNQMFDGKFSTNKVSFPKNEVSLGKSKISVYFLPEDDVYNKAIKPIISNSKDEILVSIFYLTDRNLLDELIKAKQRNVKVYVMIDSIGMINFKNRIKQLKDNKIPVIVENWGGKNHQKTMVVDKNILITGSANFSKSGFYKNDENVLIIKDSSIAEFYRDYYFYLFNSIDKKYLKLIPRAESIESINSCYDGIDNNFDGFIDKDDEGCKVKK